MSETISVQQAKEEREKLFTKLYKQTFPIVARYVSKMGGTFEEAKDIFHDSLIIYYEKAITGSLALKNGEKAYVIGIAKHLWIKKYKEDSLRADLNYDLEITDIKTERPSSKKLMQFLETTGQKCMEMLRAFYYDKLTMGDVATTFEFSSVRSATVQKYKCLEKVRDKIKEKSLAYEDFVE